MANNDRARKLLVRSGLVLSTSMATIMGAGAIASYDAQQWASVPSTTDTAVIATDITTLTTTAGTITSPAIIQHTAPNVVIFRQVGTSSTSSISNTTNTSATTPNISTRTTAPSAVANTIQPPSPQQISAPQPQVVNQPVTVRTQSSR